MDKIVMIAAVVAIAAIIGVGIMMNSSSSTPVANQGQPASQGGNNGEGASGGNSGSGGSTGGNTPGPADNHLPVETNKSAYTNAKLGVVLPDVQGDCTLYKHVVKDEFKCFGTAGNYSTFATNEYRAHANLTDYFCKPTQYGCKLYQKVTFQQ